MFEKKTASSDHIVAYKRCFIEKRIYVHKGWNLLIPCPKLFWTVQITLFEYQLGPICFSRVQIIKIIADKSNLNLTKMIWIWLKQFSPDQNSLYVPFQNNVDGPKWFWTHRRTRHKSLSSNRFDVNSL